MSPNDGIDNDRNGYIDDVYGYDFVDDDGDPSDECGHGTHIAGIIAGVANNGADAIGTDWPVKIMALKIMKPTLTLHSYECIGSSSDAIMALEYVRRMGVKCTNNSWGWEGEPYNQALADAIEKTRQLFIVAAGNNFRQDNDASPFYPASYELDNIISVCSIDNDDDLSLFSNFGRQSVDLCALGGRILSTSPNNEYTFKNGTSMAAAYVTGAAALLWSVFPELTASEIKMHLMLSAERTLKLADTNVTGGRLNLQNAITQVQSRRQTFTIYNISETMLGIEQVRLTGVNATEFNIHNDTCSSQKLASGKSCIVDVYFAPILIDAKQALLEIISDTQQTASASLYGNVIDDTSGVTETSSFNNFTSLAEPAVYYENTGEVEIPTVIVPNTIGMIDIYRAKLCSKPCSSNDNSFCFHLCGLVPLKVLPKSGNTIYNPATNIVNIPIVKYNATVRSINAPLYEANLKSNPDANFEFELIETIPIGTNPIITNENNKRLLQIHQ